MSLPILYSFRRCPYAMRARLAVASAGVQVDLREIVLKDKAPEFLKASPKGTVPVLVTSDRVIEESLDVMIWALERSDPEHLLDMPDHGKALIEANDGAFKQALDRTKYAVRFPNSDPEAERFKAQKFLETLSIELEDQPYLFGANPSLADIAIAPFIRQFAHIDRERFDADAPANLIAWLDRFLASKRFTAIMPKYPKWQAGDPVTLFPPDQTE